MYIAGVFARGESDFPIGCKVTSVYLAMIVRAAAHPAREIWGDATTFGPGGVGFPPFRCLFFSLRMYKALREWQVIARRYLPGI